MRLHAQSFFVVVSARPSTKERATPIRAVRIAAAISRDNFHRSCAKAFAAFERRF
jgi:hypothetical protein